MSTVTEATRELLAALEPIRGTLPRAAKLALERLVDALESQADTRRSASSKRKSVGRKVSVDHNAILKLGSVGNMTHAQIAEAVGCSASLVSKLLAKGDLPQIVRNQPESLKSCLTFGSDFRNHLTPDASFLASRL